MSIILEVGSGQAVWLLFERGEEISVRYPREILNDTVYICADILRTPLIRGRETLKQNEELLALVRGRIEFVNADGTCLPLPSNACDLVVLSDFFSQPEHDWCLGDGCDFTGEYFKSAEDDWDSYCCECHRNTYPYWVEQECGCEVFRGCTGETKLAVTAEAWRVLRRGGKLIICDYQTHEYHSIFTNQLFEQQGFVLEEEFKYLRWREFIAQMTGSWERIFRKV